MNKENNADVTDYNVVSILEHIIGTHHSYFRDILLVIDTKLQSTLKIDFKDVRNIAQIYSSEFNISHRFRCRSTCFCNVQ